MKIHITDGKKFLALFIAFSFFLCASLFALIALGLRTADTHSGEETHTQSETESKDDPLRGAVVVIDAGHGGEDGGTVGVNGVYEKDINLSLAISLASALEDMGAQTLLTRREDILLYDRNSDYEGQKKAQDLAARKKIAEECEGAVFVSIHMNSFPEKKYKGLQVYYSENDESSKALAQKIQSAAVKELQPENTRSCKSGKDIYLLNRLHCPAVLVECGFLSNPDECALLSSEQYQKELAYVLASAIYEHLLSAKTDK